MQQALVVNVGGIGTALDTSNLASAKTIEVLGLGAADSLEIEVSTDGVNFNPAKTFTQGNNVQRLNYPVLSIRVNATNSATGGITASVTAALSTTEEVVIPTPAVNAVGASVEISAFGDLSACSVNNLLPAGSEMRFEVSNNDVDFVPLHTFDADDCVVKNVTHKFIRAVSVGATAADLSMVSENDPAVLDAVKQAYLFMWKPDAPADKLLEGRIFAEWKDAMAAAMAARALGFIEVEIQCDASYSTKNDLRGKKTAQIPSSLVDGVDSPTLGFKVWDVNGIQIGGGGANPGGSSGSVEGGVNITFADNCVLQPQGVAGGGDIRFVMTHGFIHNESLVSSPLRPAPGWGVTIRGAEQHKYAVGHADAKALIKKDPAAWFAYFATGTNGNGGFGYGDGSASLAPIFDADGAHGVVSAEGADNYMVDNALGDSSSPKVGGFDRKGTWRRGRENTQLGIHPDLGEAGTDCYLRMMSPFNVRVPVAHGQYTPGARQITADDTVLKVGWNYVNTGVVAGSVADAAHPGSVTDFTDSGTDVILTGAGFTAFMVGKTVTVAGSTNPLNDGDFVISGQTATTITYPNASGVTEATPTATYSVAGGIEGFTQSGGNVILTGSGFNSTMVGKDVTVDGSGSHDGTYTITAQSGNTVTFVSATATEAAAGTFSVALGDMTVKAPPGNPDPGIEIGVINTGPNKVTIIPYGASDRNKGGVSDVIESPIIWGGTKGWFFCNGGLDGSDKGTWQRAIEEKPLPTAPDTVASGAMSVASLLTKMSTTGAQAYSLADGLYEGQPKVIRQTVNAGGTDIGTLTPVTFADGTTAAFNAVGEALELVWYAASGWNILVNTGGVVIA